MPSIIKYKHIYNVGSNYQESYKEIDLGFILANQVSGCRLRSYGHNTAMGESHRTVYIMVHLNLGIENTIIYTTDFLELNSDEYRFQMKLCEMLVFEILKFMEDLRLAVVETNMVFDVNKKLEELTKIIKKDNIDETVSRRIKV